MSTTLKSDYQKLDPITKQEVKQHLKKIAQTMTESSKAITRANGELGKDPGASRNPKKIELINKEISDTMDSFRERLGVILDDMKHLTNNPQGKKEIERISEDLAKPKMEKPDYQITNELKDLRDVIDPHAVKREISRSPVQNNLVKRGTPRKNYNITTPESNAKTPGNRLNKENSPVPTQKIGQPGKSRVYVNHPREPVSNSYLPVRSVKRLDGSGAGKLQPEQPGSIQRDPRRSNSVSRGPQREPQNPPSTSSRNIRRLPVNHSPNAQKPYYGGYNPSRLSQQQRKPLEASPMNPNVFKKSDGSTPAKVPVRISRSTTPQKIKHYSPSPATNLSNAYRPQPAPQTRPFQPSSVQKADPPTQGRKNIIRQPVITSGPKEKNIELKPLARPKQKFNRKRELINSMSPVPRKTKQDVTATPSPKKKKKKTKKKKKNKEVVSPAKVSPVEISPVNNEPVISASNIPIDHISGRTTEANSVKNTLILPSKFNPEYIQGEYVSIIQLLKENSGHQRPKELLQQHQHNPVRSHNG